MGSRSKGEVITYHFRDFIGYLLSSFSKKQKELEDKDAAKRAKAAEKAALLAEEEEALSSIVTKKLTKKKGKDDFDLLNGMNFILKSDVHITHWLGVILYSSRISTATENEGPKRS